MFSSRPILRQLFSILSGEILSNFDRFDSKQTKSNFYIFAGNLLTTSFGATTGWAAVNFVGLQKDDTNFPSGPLSQSQATRVVSLFFASAVVGNFMFPYIVKKVGSKRTMFVLGFPQMVSSIPKMAKN